MGVRPRLLTAVAAGALGLGALAAWIPGEVAAWQAGGAPVEERARDGIAARVRSLAEDLRVRAARLASSDPGAGFAEARRASPAEPGAGAVLIGSDGALRAWAGTSAALPEELLARARARGRALGVAREGPRWLLAAADSGRAGLAVVTAPLAPDEPALAPLLGPGAVLEAAAEAGARARYFAPGAAPPAPPDATVLSEDGSPLGAFRAEPLPAGERAARARQSVRRGLQLPVAALLLVAALA
ncbi:MAG: hypothetical protein L0216_16335, partial [Planctomycetales bacterium]|nr:hypothetical protein [Planctomycetales bacterium]